MSRRALIVVAISALLLAAAVVRAEHPVGDLDKPRRDLDRVGCLDCHAPHGTKDQDSLLADPSGGACLDCHERTVSARRSRLEHPRGIMVRDLFAIKRVIEAGGRLGDKATVTCLTCHKTHEDLEPTSLCLACHADRERTMDDGGLGHGGGECFTCHSVHRGNASALSRRTPSQGDPKGCLTCHGAGNEYEPETARPGRDGHPHFDRDGGLAQTRPPLRTCMSCHTLAHDPRQLKDDSCEGCHDAQAAEQARGGHGTATCMDCHPAHEPMPALVASTAKLNPVSRRCLSCHSGETRVELAKEKVAEYDHPEMVFRPDGQRWTPLGNLPLFDPSGERVPAGQNGDLTCISCHTTHGPEEGRPARGLKRSGWEEPCAACHGQEALPFFLYFHEPKMRGGDPKTGL